MSLGNPKSCPGPNRNWPGWPDLQGLFHNPRVKPAFLFFSSPTPHRCHPDSEANVFPTNGVLREQAWPLLRTPSRYPLSHVGDAGFCHKGTWAQQLQGPASPVPHSRGASQQRKEHWPHLHWITSVVGETQHHTVGWQQMAFSPH